LTAAEAVKLELVLGGEPCPALKIAAGLRLATKAAETTVKLEKRRVSP